MSQLSEQRTVLEAAATALSLAVMNANALGLITKIQLLDDGTANVRLFVEDTKIPELTA